MKSFPFSLSLLGLTLMWVTYTDADRSTPEFGWMSDRMRNPRLRRARCGRRVHIRRWPFPTIRPKCRVKPTTLAIWGCLLVIWVTAILTKSVWLPLALTAAVWLAVSYLLPKR